MDYYEEAPFFGYQTAGWFVVGIPILIGIALTTSMVIAYLARKYSPWLGWPISVLVFGILIYQSASKSTPNKRLASVLDMDLANINVVRLQQWDSLNEGVSTTAVIIAGEEFYRALCVKHDLWHALSRPDAFRSLRDSDLPATEPVNLDCNNTLTCYHDHAKRRIFIHHHSHVADDPD